MQTFLLNFLQTSRLEAFLMFHLKTSVYFLSFKHILCTYKLIYLLDLLAFCLLSPVLNKWVVLWCTHYLSLDSFQYLIYFTYQVLLPAFAGAVPVLASSLTEYFEL